MTRKLNEFRTKKDSYVKAIEEAKVQLAQNEIQLKLKIEELKKLQIDSFGKTMDSTKLNQLNQDILLLETSIKELTERIAVYEDTMQDRLQEDIVPVIQERQKLMDKQNKRLDEIEQYLFEAKLKYMKEIEDAIIERESMIAQLNEYHQEINRIQPESEPTLRRFNIYNRDYIATGGSTPVVVQDYDLRSLGCNHYGGKPRQASSYILFKRTGEIIQNEQEAYERLNELTQK